jgi:hypothetical protein
MNEDDDDPGWFATQFTEEQAALLREGMTDAIENASSSFGAALRRLEAAVTAVPPFDLICVTAFYFLTGEAGVNPEYNRPEDIFQHHVELIHAFALRHPLDKATPTAPLQGNTLEVLDAAKEVMRTYTLVEMARISTEHDEARRRRAMAIAEMRSHAATVRGWSYYTELSEVLAELFAPIESDIEGALGISPIGLVAWWWAVTKRVEERIAIHRQQIHDLLTTPLTDAWAASVEEVFPRLAADLDDALVARLRGDEDQRQAFTIVTADLNLYQVFGVTAKELLECYPGTVDEETLESVVDAWSLSFGETGQQPLHGLIQDNPVASRPLVKLKRGLYLWANAAAFNHSAFVMLERLLETNDAVWCSYSHRRADFLEERVAVALRQAFPNGRVWTNVVWVDHADGKKYETDVLLLVGSHAVIAECKSGRVSHAARKGKGRAFREDVNDLIVEPARQAQRFADFLVGQSGHLELATREGEPVLVDADGVGAAITMGVTLEPVAGLLPRIGEIVESEFSDQAIESLTHSLTLFDLLVVLEMLNHPSELLHYFLRRSQIEKNQFLIGDETDLLGFYLLTGFNLGDAEFGTELQRMRLIGLSDTIDTYHYAVEAGKEAEKPQVRRTEWWEALLTTVERRAGPKWTELGLALCNVAYDEQREFEHAFEELRLSIHEGQRAATDFVLFANGPTERRDYFIGLILGESPSEQTRQQIADAARQAMAEKDELRRVIVIGWPTVRQRAPYHTIGVFDRGTQ